MYLTTGLFNFPHWRSTVMRKCSSRVPSTGPHTCNMVTTYIPPSVNCFIDKASDVLSVI